MLADLELRALKAAGRICKVADRPGPYGIALVTQGQHHPVPLCNPDSDRRRPTRQTRLKQPCYCFKHPQPKRRNRASA